MIMKKVKEWAEEDTEFLMDNLSKMKVTEIAEKRDFSVSAVYSKVKILGLKKDKKWTKEKILLEAKKYEARWKFNKGSGGAYMAARDYGILDEACVLKQVPQLYES